MRKWGDRELKEKMASIQMQFLQGFLFIIFNVLMEGYVDMSAGVQGGR